MSKYIVEVESGSMKVDFRKVSADVENVKNAAKAATTEEDYVLWVRQWKQVYRDLTEAVIGLRNQKNFLKVSSRSSEISSLWANRMYLRPSARELSELRVEMKAKLHQGSFDKKAVAA